LAYHNAQLEANAFKEEFDEDGFEDPSAPPLDMIHKRAGKLLQEWRQLVQEDESANTVVVAKAGAKRKADVSVSEAEIRSKYDDGTLAKLTNDVLKAFLKSKSLAVSGKKDDLVTRIGEWIDSHP